MSNVVQYENFTEPPHQYYTWKSKNKNEAKIPMH